MTCNCLDTSTSIDLDDVVTVNTAGQLVCGSTGQFLSRLVDENDIYGTCGGHSGPIENTAYDNYGFGVMSQQSCDSAHAAVKKGYGDGVINWKCIEVDGKKAASFSTPVTCQGSSIQHAVALPDACEWTGAREDEWPASFFSAANTAPLAVVLLADLFLTL
ncbi:hypothetical protein LTR56_026955 [Elasticomyces elasticus]|nr:hypothetical protein LTR56_026955 [Elasticomyces elasticus]KAK3617611.1 hypothetical protein LTR22_026681 [Elasticomyces elasticus]KAK4899861.1 hypothetical protein LTR49_027574 [Elasticomyces elasticus]KAK5736197.1 hypothetical protein LTS12_026241 [Elasticomyces elasticus]